MYEPEVKPTTFEYSKLSNPNSKHQKVKKHLLENGSIDKFIAKELYGASRLPSIINRLRNKGYNIISINNLKSTTYKYIK